MHLFESPWLHEPNRRDTAPSYRRPTFGPRYGRDLAPSPTQANSVVPPLAPLFLGDFQSARATLREMARYDHAA